MTPLQWKRLFYRMFVWAVLIGLSVFLFVLVAATWQVYSKGKEAELQHKNAQQNVDDLLQRKASDEAALQKLDTPRGVEEVIRSRYELGKPGEEEIVLVSSATTTLKKQEKESLWDTLFGWIPRF